MMLLLRQACMGILLILGSLWHVYASYVEIDVPILSEFGSIAGFTTQDPHLAYMVPKSWTVYENNLYRTDNDFYFILSPSFDTQTLAQYKLAHPDVLMVPIPHILSETQLFLADVVENDFLLGKLQHSVTPDHVVNQSDLIYYNIRVDDDALAGFVNLLNSNIGLTGYLNLSYPFSGQVTNTQIPLFIKASQISQTIPDDYELVWIKRLLSEHCLLLNEVVDAELSLGFQSIHIESLDGLGCWNKDNFALHAISEGDYQVNGIDPLVYNFDINTRLHLIELGLEAQVHMTTQIQVSLDLFEVTVSLDELAMIDINVDGDNVSSFYQYLIQREIEAEKDNIKASVSSRLTQEFQIRIINGNLFL
ncbi:hypothetical protein [Shewanella surugensis]|uniref:DUF2066 domain-containing protein n=1 Tax=Shewanella surugensis TaxID=212020 RepID=A0ABT0LIZ3_9GAMM|nr:hypothetical protein [Shewanella surugensis]MCL1127681.1 hypothetical protein [Shewanella surugensis]